MKGKSNGARQSVRKSILCVCVCVCVCSVRSMCGYLSLRQELDVLGSLGLVLWDSAVHVWDLAIRKEAGMNAENKRCLGMSWVIWGTVRYVHMFT